MVVRNQSLLVETLQKEKNKQPNKYKNPHKIQTTQPLILDINTVRSIILNPHMQQELFGAVPVAYSDHI